MNNLSDTNIHDKHLHKIMFSDYEKQLTNICKNCVRRKKKGFDDYNSPFSFQESTSQTQPMARENEQKKKK